MHFLGASKEDLIKQIRILQLSSHPTNKSELHNMDKESLIRWGFQS